MGKKVLIVIGHEEIENTLSKLKNIEIVDKDDDIELITSILEDVQPDYVIVNTILSHEKSIALAQSAKKIGVKIIAIVKNKNDPALIPALVGAGVYAFAETDELYMIQDFVDEYPADFDFTNLTSAKRNGSNSGEDGLYPPASKKSKVTVAMMGCMGRIGTTTQALMMTKFLVDRGFKACYIEANNHHHIKDLLKEYTEAKEEKIEKATYSEDETIGKVTYKDVDMFYKTSELATVVKLPYQYFVYDYGDFHDLEQEISWQEKDIHVLCTGTKPNEIKHLLSAFDILGGKRHGTKYVFSFSHVNEHKEIIRGMKGSAKDTFFASYAPDPFMDSEDFYEQLLELPIGSSVQINSKPTKGKLLSNFKLKLPFLNGGTK